MYKDGKQWVFAAVTAFVLVAGAGVVGVNADEISDQQATSAAMTQSQKVSSGTGTDSSRTSSVVLESQPQNSKDEQSSSITNDSQSNDDVTGEKGTISSSRLVATSSSNAVNASSNKSDKNTDAIAEAPATIDKDTAAGVNTSEVEEDNALGIAALYGIFTKHLTLNADTNSNFATENLDKGTTDFGSRGSKNSDKKSDTYHSLSDKDLYYI